MEKGKSNVASAADSLQDLTLSSISSSRPIPSSTRITATLRSTGVPNKKTKPPPSLVTLCLGVVGKHLEDIVSDLEAIAASFPADVKMVIVAIARRRRLLDDNVILSLADSSWEILDLSGSDVSDSALKELAITCRSLRAVDIRKKKLEGFQSGEGGGQGRHHRWPPPPQRRSLAMIKEREGGKSGGGGLDPGHHCHRGGRRRPLRLPVTSSVEVVAGDGAASAPGDRHPTPRGTAANMIKLPSA
ncbi:hypothetical protein CDL15_Pgr002532 [Punica granatum]|uniref:Uncharacterized protein n=1 Tax=Punica granatum TaxID=22663 RepID=A0A218XUC7_PUNGR|nr:hypothetical protein CDL15_Pgr002532 [Punica granatum]